MVEVHPGYGTSRGRVAFSLPAPFEAGTARIEVAGAALGLPDRVLDVLARPLSEWEYDSVSIPGRLTAGEPFEVSVGVLNTGGLPGRFRGLLNTGGVEADSVPDPFVLDVGPGTKRSWTYRTRAPDTGGNVEFHLRTSVGDRDVTAEVAGDTSTDASSTEAEPRVRR